MNWHGSARSTQDFRPWNSNFRDPPIREEGFAIAGSVEVPVHSSAVGTPGRRTARPTIYAHVRSFGAPKTSTSHPTSPGPRASRAGDAGSPSSPWGTASRAKGARFTPTWDMDMPGTADSAPTRTAGFSYPPSATRAPDLSARSPVPSGVTSCSSPLAGVGRSKRASSTGTSNSTRRYDS